MIDSIKVRITNRSLQTGNSIRDISLKRISYVHIKLSLNAMKKKTIVGEQSSDKAR